MTDERCPGCGQPWESLPDGHSSAISMTTGEWSCMTIKPISVEEYLSGTSTRDRTTQ